MMASVGWCVLLVAVFAFQVTLAHPPGPPASSDSRTTPELMSSLSNVFSGALSGFGAAGAAAQQQVYSNDWGTGLCDKNCTCGLPNRSTPTRIVGGKPTQINEFPWVVALKKNGNIFCGGTLITNLHVLTAAHCVQGNQFMIRRTTTIILAEHDILWDDESPVETRRIASIARHPDFRPYFNGHLGGDIALIRMSYAVEFSAYLAPACLPSPGVDFAGSKGTIAGWGVTSNSFLSLPSHELLAAEVPILSQEVCQADAIFHFTTLTKDMMCAGRKKGGVDSCQGDSGGGLFVTDAFKRMVTAGIVSWGEGCARPRRPGIYTRVNHYLTWIQYHTKDACFCA